MTVATAKREAAVSTRLYYFDWLRVLIIGLVFVGHRMMPFSGAPRLIAGDVRLRYENL